MLSLHYVPIYVDILGVEPRSGHCLCATFLHHIPTCERSRNRTYAKRLKVSYTTTVLYAH